MLTKSLKKKYTRFALLNLIVTAILLIAWSILKKPVGEQYITSAAPWIILFFLALNLLVFYLMLKVTTRRFSKFVNLFLLTTSLKLLVFLAIIIMYSFLNRQHAVAFILNFFVVYLVYTIIEVVHVMRAQQTLKKSRF